MTGEKIEKKMAEFCLSLIRSISLIAVSYEAQAAE
jgi:hypothetical protein